MSLPIPPAVAAEAKVGIKLLQAGFSGGTETGWRRANQLAKNQNISVADLAVMRAWFARHGPDALHAKEDTKCALSKTGTSYPGYLKWIADGAPVQVRPGKKNSYRGAVAWLIWGGDAAYRWLKTEQVVRALEAAYPAKKSASHCIRLQKLGLASSFV
jgi:hypothetical protein